MALDSSPNKPDFKFLNNELISRLLLREINNPEAVIRKSVIECLAAAQYLMGTVELKKVVSGKLNETQE